MDETKMKCINCGIDNLDKNNLKLAGASEISGLKDASERLGLEYQLVICPACVIGFSLISLSMMIRNEDKVPNTIVSDSLHQAASKYFITYHQNLENASFRDEHT